jgi:Protein of unknown function (DUF1572)
MIIESIESEFQKYKSMAEKAISQIGDGDIHKVVGVDGNSIAILVRHISGNLRSRFTDFLTDDGEKSWRNRDQEFIETAESRQALLQNWEEGWEKLTAELGRLDDTELPRTVKIRGEEMTVIEALHKSLAHVASHVGQIILMARLHTGSEWDTLSIPRGKSEEFYRISKR